MRKDNTMKIVLKILSWLLIIFCGFGIFGLSSGGFEDAGPGILLGAVVITQAVLTLVALDKEK